MQFAMGRVTLQTRVVAVILLVAVTLSLMAVSSGNESTVVTGDLKIENYSALEMELAGVIREVAVKLGMWSTANSATTYATRIINLIFSGSDVATAIGFVLGFLGAGIVVSVTSIAAFILKQIIKYYGKLYAITW